MTNDEVQRLLDKAYTGVIEQGQLSIDVDGVCRYRMTTIEGKLLKCGVGHLIPDSEYTPKLEGQVCAGQLIRDVLTKVHGDFSFEQWQAVKGMQSAHDSSGCLVGETEDQKFGDFKQQWSKKAEYHGYTVPEVSE